MRFIDLEAGQATWVLPVHGTGREEFSALVSYMFAGPLRG